VAARYDTTSIPRTVVIDREGNVARVFVGSAVQLAEHLRSAVRDLLPAAE
jgi:hypothetical protein